MSAEAIAQAEKLIPCEVRMISGCRDEQTSADGECCGDDENRCAKIHLPMVVSQSLL